MNKDLYNKTSTLLRQLNYFLVHVVVYFVSTFIMVYLLFLDFDKNWWIIIALLAWSIGLIYHAFRIYGVDFLKSRNKKNFLNWFLKIAGV